MNAARVLSLTVFVACLMSLAPVRGEEASLRVDALQITLDSNGALKSLRVGDKVFPGGGNSASGLFIREGADQALVPAALGAGADRITEFSKSGFRVTARIEAREDRMILSGVIEDTRGAEDRAVDVVLRVPFAPAVWWGSISEKVAPDAEPPAAKKPRNPDALVEGAAALEPIESGGLAQNYLPVACVTSADESAGLAVAIPPDAPCRFRFAQLRTEGCVELQFLFGLSPAATGDIKSRATFRCEIFSADGHWGLRDAWRRYEEMHAEFFQRSTQASGLWLVSAPKLADVPDPQNYAFWQTTRTADTAQGIKLGMEVFPYTIIGQREVGFIKSKIANYNDVLRVLAEKPETTHRSRYTWEEVTPFVENCGLHGADGRWLYRLRETDWAGNSVSFPVNPSPFLPSSEARPSVAEHTFAEVGRALREHPELHGFFVDSLAMWGSYENYRRDHFAAARAPLTHDEHWRVSLPNWMPHVDYLRELRHRIEPRLVFGNGPRPGRAFCAFLLDVFGVEFSPRDLESRVQFDFLRCVAGPRPALGLFDYPASGLTREQMEDYVQHATALGIAPETRHFPWPKYKDRDADLIAKFLPIYRRLDRAGWQSVTHARSENSAAWIERFGGDGGDLFFSLFNPTDTTLTTRVIADLKALGPTSAKARELVTDADCEPAASLTIPAKSVRVLHFAKP